MGTWGPHFPRKVGTRSPYSREYGDPGSPFWGVPIFPWHRYYSNHVTHVLMIHHFSTYTIPCSINTKRQFGMRTSSLTHKLAPPKLENAVKKMCFKNSIFVQFMQFLVLDFGLGHSDSQPFNCSCSSHDDDLSENIIRKHPIPTTCGWDFADRFVS